MPERNFSIRATHAKTKEHSALHLEVGQEWEVGRRDGNDRSYRWNIDFDPALSRLHFRFKVLEELLLIEAANNRHPIIFEGFPQQRFDLACGQQFTSAHTTFEFIKVTQPAANASISTSNLDLTLDLSLDILSFTKVCAVLLSNGLSYSRLFQQLQTYQSPWMRGTLHLLEKSVVIEGFPLSKALSKYPHLFSPSYLGMVELGESTDLGRAMSKQCEQLAMDYRKHKLRPSEQSAALVAACRNVAEVLGTGHLPQRALELAGKASPHHGVSQALLELAVQLQSQPNLEDCQFHPMFLPSFPAWVAAYQSVGKLGNAFSDLADLLEP